MPDLYREASEALKTATHAVQATRDDVRPEAIQLAFVTLLDAISQVARVVGIPDAIEPGPGATPNVSTEIS